MATVFDATDAVASIGRKANANEKYPLLPTGHADKFLCTPLLEQWLSLFPLSHPYQPLALATAMGISEVPERHDGYGILRNINY